MGQLNGNRGSERINIINEPLKITISHSWVKIISAKCYVFNIKYKVAKTYFFNYLRSTNALNLRGGNPFTSYNNLGSNNNKTHKACYLENILILECLSIAPTYYRLYYMVLACLLSSLAFHIADIVKRESVHLVI